MVAGAVELGSGYVSVWPSTNGPKFASALNRQLSSPLSSAGASGGKVLGGGLVKAAMGAIAAAGIGAAVVAGAKKGLDYNAVLEQNKVGFETMLGSAKAAGKMLGDLQRFAAKTPFEFPELAASAKQMLAMGFSAKEIMPTLTAVGDAASGLGLGAEGVDRVVRALGQMRAKGKVSAEEMMQLTEAGVPAWDILAKSMGKSVAETMKLSEKGLIPADKAVGALVNGMGKRFPNMMAKQSKTFSGLMSTLKDNTNQVLGQVMAPLFEKIKNLLPPIIDGIGRFSEGFAKGGFLAGLGAMVPAIKPVLDTLKGFFSMLTGGQGVLDSFGIAVAENLGVDLMPVMRPLYKAADGIRKLFANIARTVGPVLQASFATLKASMAPLMASLAPLWAQLKPALTTIAQVAGGALLVALGLLVGVINGVVRALGPLLRALAGLATIVVSVFNLIVGIVTLDGKRINAAIGGIKTGIINVFGGLWGAVKGLLTGFIDGVVGFFKGLYNTLVGHSIVPDMINGIVGWFGRLPGMALRYVGTLVSRTVAKLGELKTRAMQAGRGLLEGLKRGLSIGSVVQSVINAATGVVRRIINAVKSFLGIGGSKTTGGGGTGRGGGGGIGDPMGSWVNGRVGKLVSDKVGSLASFGGIAGSVAKGLGIAGLQPGFAAKLLALMAAVKAMGGHLSITSGWRSIAQQRALFAQKGPRLAAPPGRSRHNYGLAADLSGSLGLAHRLAKLFGLSFPMSYEPWHIQGVRHAGGPINRSGDYTLKAGEYVLNPVQAKAYGGGPSIQITGMELSESRIEQAVKRALFASSPRGSYLATS